LKKYMRRRNRQTSLWSLIEAMQQRLEAEGLERNVVDVAVTEGLKTLFAPASNGRDQTRASSLLKLGVPALT